MVIDSVQRFSVGRDRAIIAYRAGSVETATPGELVLMLYNEAVRSMKDSLVYMGQNDMAGSNSKLLRAQDIIDELRISLNLASGGDIAKRLASVYDFAYASLLSANVRKDPILVENVVKVFAELRDGWEELLHSNV